MNGWYTKLAYVENGKLDQLTNTIKIWLQQAVNHIDEGKVQDSLVDVFPVIDDAVTLQNAISNAQDQVATAQGGQITPTQSTLISLLTQRVQDGGARKPVNQMQNTQMMGKILKPLQNLQKIIEDNKSMQEEPAQQDAEASPEIE
jgi:hypothetical protein